MFSALRSRKVQIAGQTVVITALVGGTAAFVGLNKQVTLVVDGQAEQVRTFSANVSDFLESQQVEIVDGDQVQPGADADITRGMDVVVNTLKEVDLTLDGVAYAESTTGNTVAEALADLGVDPEGAEISTELESPLTNTESTALTVVTPKTITVVADGTRTPVDITAATAQEVVDESGVEFGENDTLSLPASAPVMDGGVIEVLRTTTEEQTETETLTHTTTEKNDSSLERGTTKVETKGKDGSKDIVYSVTKVNGEVVIKEKKSEKVTAEPVDQVVLVGTKEPEPEPEPTPEPEVTEDSDDNDSGSGSDNGSGDDSSGSGDSGGSDDSGSGDNGGGNGGGSNPQTTEEIKAMLGGPGSPWYNIVKCESTFNPRAVNPAGYYGLFQFDLQTWRSVGGSGNPIDASPKEQFDRAKKLHSQRGFQPWGCRP